MTYGWLSPDGELFECPYYGHIGLAVDLVEKYKIDTKKLYEEYDVLCEDDALLYSGWIKIGRDSSTNGYSIVLPETSLLGIKARILKTTEAQKAYLKHMYDNEPDKITGIWLDFMEKLGVI